MPESADSRPRLGALLLSAGLLTQEQLDECLAVAQAAGKRLGQVLVESGVVPARSIAMALADQHGGPLKTEFGFATGHGSTSRTRDIPGVAAGVPPVSRLASAESGASNDLSTPAAPVVREAAAQPAADVVQLEAETAARLSAEAQAAELLARVAELQTELEAAGHRAAADAALRSQLAAEREARGQDAKTVEAWRAQLEEARAANAQAAEAAKGLRAQLEELRTSDRAAAAATAIAEELLASVRDELAAAFAAGEELRLQLAAERATNERASASTDAVSAQTDELRGQRATESVTEDSLAAARAELAAAVADVDGLRDTLANERAKSEQMASTAETLRAELDELRMNSGAVDAPRARVVELEAVALRAAAREAEPPVVVPAHLDVDELRAVIELQEQALAAATARGRAWESDACAVVAASSTHCYSNDLHFLFAPRTDGYELFERSGPSPSPGEVVELSGGRTCRVTRVGPAPFPGAPEACAYLELA